MWKLYAFFEGLTKTGSSLFTKYAGLQMATLEMGFIFALIIGAVQCAVGLFGFIFKINITRSRIDGIMVSVERNDTVAKPLFPDARSVLWAILFGFFASMFGTVLWIYTLMLGADLGTQVFLLTFAVVPGAIAGRLIWGDPLGIRQWVGILVFLVAAWAMLNFPSPDIFLSLPLWVWLTLVISFSQVVSEILSRASGIALDPWRNNFWVGVSTIFFSIFALFIFVLLRGEVVLELSRPFMLASSVVACTVVVMLTFKLLAYQGGGTIALKKIITPGTFMVTGTIAGILVYDEPATMGKVFGICLWPLAIIFMDNDIWKVLLGFRHVKSVASN